MILVRRGVLLLLGGAKQVRVLIARYRTLRGCAAAVARELEANAVQIDRLTQQKVALQAVRAGLTVSVWQQHAPRLSALAERQPAVWARLQETYTALEASMAGGAVPPGGDDLRDLADDLREGAGL
jgi:hypothetical protein